MTVLPFFEFSLYEMFHMFCFWSFIGWCIEVCYMTLETGEYQNRGFLNMPICPIYGFGVLMVVIFFRPISHTVIPLFLVTMTLCTFFELLVGLGMEKLFHMRWWDYSNERFNFKGYVCLKVSLLWGFGCVFVIRIVQPIVEKIVDSVPVKFGLVGLIIMSVLIATDLIASISTVNQINSRLKQLDEISSLMLKSSVKIGEKLASETIEISEKYDKLISTRNLAIERLIKAYPSMRSINYSDSMEKLKEKIHTPRAIVKIKKKYSDLKIAIAGADGDTEEQVQDRISVGEDLKR